MKPFALVLALAIGAAALRATDAPPLTSGLDLTTFDRSVRPQDDLYRFVNGAWLATAQIPPDRVSYGTFAELADQAEERIRDLILASAAARGRSAPAQRVVDLYDSLMDEARLEQLGVGPARPELARIDAIADVRALAAEAGRLSVIGFGGPFSGAVEIDRHDVIARVTQGGTLLRYARDYLADDAASVALRADYEKYLGAIFTLAGRADPAGDARAVLALETAIARAQAPEETLGQIALPRYALSRLTTEMPGFDWTAWAKPQGIDRASALVFVPPSFFKTFASLAATVPLETWKAWLAARYLTAAAPFLNRAFGEARFEFFGRILTGQEIPRIRWKRGVSLVNGYLGDAAGRMYVEKHFPSSARPRVKRLVGHVIGACETMIRDAAWMSATAKRRALDTLAGMSVKIGYPDAWRSYAGLEIRPGDLLGNLQRAQQFDSEDRVRRLRDPARRDEWLMTPQTVNAYYSPDRNEFVLPAAVLQPPLFDVAAEDAVNYGAIGAVVAHEIAHGLDGHGAFHDRALALVDQFNAFTPLEGLHVDGVRTFRENLADLVGLDLAHRAYRRSLEGRPPPVLDGFTGDQRVFLGWARLWRNLERPEYVRQAMASSLYPPFQYRANGIAGNVAAFYEAFGVKAGDALFREPGRRVRIW